MDQPNFPLNMYPKKEITKTDNSVRIDTDSDRFTMKLAESDEDIAAAQRLRYRVFVEEMKAEALPEDIALRRERDKFDQYCDHLLLIDNEAVYDDPLDKVIGAYRLLRGVVAKNNIGFCGDAEYDLSLIYDYPRETVELGRSCTDAAYRRGMAMHLLWSGLGQYMKQHRIEVMFGLASFHNTDPKSLALPLSYLYYNHLAPEDLRVRSHEEFYVKMDTISADQVERREAMKQMPALLKAYIRVGGFIGDGACVDHKFNTTDVCLLVDTSRMTERYRAFYQL